MLTLFNSDMGRRLADLTHALGSGKSITLKHEGGFRYHQGELPERVIVTIEPSRRFVLDKPMALAVADQLTINGDDGTASQLRGCFASA